MGSSVPGLKPTFEKHLDAVKWMIGLPVAVLFGTGQFVEKIDFLKHPYAGMLLMWIVIVNAAAAVASVWYYFVAIHMADLKILGTVPTKGEKAVDALSFGLGFLLLASGFLLTVVGLINYPSVQAEKPPASSVPAIASTPYRIRVSGPVHDRRGTHYHTFLVNEATGAVWRLDCGGASGISFVSVPVNALSPSKK